MTALRAQMIKQMQLHRLAPRTQRAYANAVKNLAIFYRQSPDQLSPSQVQDYLHAMLVEQKLSWSTCNIAIHAFRFFYVKMLRWSELHLELPRCRREQRLPEILSTEEVKRLLAAPSNPKSASGDHTFHSAHLRV